MSAVKLLAAFFAGYLNFIGVNYYHKITRVEVRSKGGFIFAAQDRGDCRGQATEALTICVHNVPLLFGGVVSW
jgi:hypothetical protein